MSAEFERAPVYEMRRYRVPTPTVVIVDDQSTGRMVLAEILRGIHPRLNLVPFADPLEALEFVRSRPVDLVLTDYLMPRLDGIEITRALRKLRSPAELPIVMTTVVQKRDLIYRAFDAGVTDYLLRPIDPVECRIRCENLLRVRSHFLAQNRHIELLSTRLEAVKGELRLSEDGALERLVALNRLHDRESAARCQQDVASFAGHIARGLGCAEAEVALLCVAASVHDIGELALPSDLWSHPNPLTPSQSERLRRHTILGHGLLAGDSSRLLNTAAEIALNHHERLDGTGYPHGLAGNAIPLMARIVAVADVFNALISPRQYKKAMSCEQALAFMQQEMHAKFDPDAMDVLAGAIDELTSLRQGRAASPSGVGNSSFAGIRHG
ncbi:MAG: response regulator [Lacisediminimonas sp.]|nr:response regulator [Lacisediminimonas sp.]